MSAAAPHFVPHSAMVLAAGLGQRMRPLTLERPKPLIEVAGKPLIEHLLDKLAEAGVASAVVNVHYLADMIERRLAGRGSPRVIISDERAQLLDTGGGVVKALPYLGRDPFFHLNSDSIWRDGPQPNLLRLAAAFDPARMDALLLLAPTTGSLGYSGRGDFAMDGEGRLARRSGSETLPFVYSGCAILAPALFRHAPQEPFSLTRLFDQAQSEGRLYGLPLEGLWMHVGTPEAIPLAEAAITAGAVS